MDGADVVDHVDAEAVPLPQPREEIGVAGAAGTEPEVASDEHGAGSERVDQHLADELLGRLRGARLVEGQQERGIHSRTVEQLELLVRADHVRRAPVRAEDAQRVAVEGDGDDLSPVGRLDPCTVDHGPVAGVHAVEFADRDDRGTEPRRHVRRIAEDDHDAVPRCRISHHRPRNGSTSGMNR